MTQQAVRITRIRAKRPKPGLQPQHLAAVRATAAISHAQVEGAEIGSGILTFEPAGLFPGSYRFEIGTAGATSLVLQTVWLPLALAGQPSEITVTGGTHVPWSPCYHYLAWQWLPFMRRIGFGGEIELYLAGFYPQGGGILNATIQPATETSPLRLTERGALKSIRGISAVANLDLSIAERQRSHALRRLQGRHKGTEIEVVDLRANTKGTAVVLLAEFRHGSACYSSLGALGKRAEQVADEACLWLEKFLATNGAIDEYLADQLLLPLAFAGGVSEFRTAKITEHLLTNAEVIRAFGAAEIEIEGEKGKSGVVSVTPGNAKPFDGTASRV